MAQNSDLRDAKNLMSLPNMLDAQGKSIKFVDTQNLLGSSTIGGICNGHSITADEGNFKNVNVSKDIEVSGNVRIKGLLQAQSINIDATSIILSIDYNNITENMKHMNPEELEFLRKHLKKVEMMIEKELFDRT